VQDLAQILNGEQVAAFDLTTLVPVASEPAPEQQTLHLLNREYSIHAARFQSENVPRSAFVGSTCC
jgi:hypothetical protein